MLSKIGVVNNQLIADVDKYERVKYLDGFANIRWRSGVKHDAAKVMELKQREGFLYNGFGEKVEIEENGLYPLLKSSDVGNGRFAMRKFIIITHKTSVKIRINY